MTILGSVVRRMRERMARPAEEHLLFAFTGGSGAWNEMGRELYRRRRVFRDAIEAANVIVEEMFDWSPAARFRGQDDPPTTIPLERRNEIIQLGILQLAQVDLWAEEGITPAGVLGVSLGEMVAPYAAGAISRDDCARILAAVAHAVSQTATDERMFIVAADASEAQRLCRTAPREMLYLGSMTPALAVVLCSANDAPAIREVLGDANLRELETEWRYHTPRLDLGRALLAEQLRDVRTMPARCPIYSAAAGGKLPANATFDAQFFGWMVSRPFRYADAVTAALADGFDLFVNLGPQPANNKFLSETAIAHGRAIRLVDSMRIDEELASWQRATSEVKRARLTPPQQRDPQTIAITNPPAGTDLFALYETLRRHGSVQRFAAETWIVLGYDDVQRALADPQRFSSRETTLLATDPVLLGNDPPDHTAMRRLLTAYFSAEANARRSVFAEETAARLLERAKGELDAVHDFANPLSDAFAADFVGLDDDAVATLLEPTIAAGGGTSPLYTNLREPLAAIATRSSLYRELRESMGEAEALSLLRLLWISAKTPRRAIGLAMLLLLERHDVREAIANDRELLGPFIDEALRLRPPEHVLPRVATEDVELGGKLIPAGATVMLCIAAANRDPAKFERPAELRLDRGAATHLSFGAGVHRCIGAPLGKQQLLAALRALFRVAPDFHAMQPLSTVRYSPHAPQRELEELVIGL